jgi:hypothetical protein
VGDDLSRLRPEQRDLLARWVPDARVRADHSWGLVDTVVLELSSSQGRLVLKAGGPSDSHIERELRAHREWLRPWVVTGHAPTLLHGDASAKVLITRYLPGRLLEGTPAQNDPDTYRQAGELLARYHGQVSAYDAAWHDKFRARARRNLDLPHRIDPDVEQMVRADVSTWPGGGSDVVPTHGDWQPRNWLVDVDGTVRVIDLGRADLRPAVTDLARVDAQDFRRDTALEAAFLEGYGSDPRSPGLWLRTRLREAISTAVWAFRVGDEAFEQQGHRRIAEALADC